MRTALIVMSISAALALSGCSRERQDWRSAQAADSIEAYNRFLESHPESELAPQARARIAQLAEERDWERASKADTAAAYRQFLALHPQGKWAQEARIRIENFSLGNLPPAPPAASSAPAAQAPPEPPPAAAPKPQAGPPAAEESTARAGSANAAGYGIQLGAFSSESAARNAWKDLSARFGAELAGLTPRITAARTSAGRLFRLQADVSAEARAREICGALRKKGQGCVVVLPSP